MRREEEARKKTHSSKIMKSRDQFSYTRNSILFRAHYQINSRNSVSKYDMGLVRLDEIFLVFFSFFIFIENVEESLFFWVGLSSKP